MGDRGARSLPPSWCDEELLRRRGQSGGCDQRRKDASLWSRSGMRSFLTNRTGSGPVSPISFGMSARMTSLAGSSFSRPQNRTWRGTPRLIQYWENHQKYRSMRRTNSIRVMWMSTRNLRPNECPNQKPTLNWLRSMVSLSLCASKVVCWPFCWDERSDGCSTQQLMGSQTSGEFKHLAEGGSSVTNEKFSRASGCQFRSRS